MVVAVSPSIFPDFNARIYDANLEIIGPSNNTRCINVTPCPSLSLSLSPFLSHFTGILYGLESASLRFIGVYIINCRIRRLSPSSYYIYIYSHFLDRWFAVSDTRRERPPLPSPTSSSFVACAWHFKDSRFRSDLAHLTRRVMSKGSFFDVFRGCRDSSFNTLS